MTGSHDHITIRLAHAGDAVALHDLAQLDSAAPLADPVVLAEVAGTARAALSVADGRSVADPFFPTLHLLELLELHAHELRTGERARPARNGHRRRWPLRVTLLPSPRGP